MTTKLTIDLEQPVMKNFREKLIKDLRSLNVTSDISIEELADDLIDDIKHINGRTYVELFGTCPICINCPKNCPLDSK